jgi:hypothetical protein
MQPYSVHVNDVQKDMINLVHTYMQLQKFANQNIMKLLVIKVHESSRNRWGWAIRVTTSKCMKVHEIDGVEPRICNYRNLQIKI